MLNEKCKAILDVEARLKDLAEKAAKIATVKRSLETTYENLREELTLEMAAQGCLQTEYAGLSFALQNAPRRVIVADESRIPDEFFKITKTLDKKKLNEEMKDHDIDGCLWSNGGQQLVIRAKSRR